MEDNKVLPKNDLKDFVKKNKVILLVCLFIILFSILGLLIFTLFSSLNKNNNSNNVDVINTPVASATSTLEPTAKPTFYINNDLTLKVEQLSSIIVSSEPKEESCSNIKDYVSADVCKGKESITINTTHIKNVNGDAYIDLQRSGVGGDCPTDEYTLKDYSLKFLQKSYILKTCRNISTNKIITNPSNILIVKNSNTNYPNLMISVYANDESSLTELLNYLNIFLNY